MGTNLIRAMLLASASVGVAAAVTPVAAYAQEATYQIDIPAQSMGDALRALGKATKQNIVFSGSVVKGKRSAAVKGRMSASEALDRLLAGSGLKMSRGSGGGLVVMGGNADAAPARAEAPDTVGSSSVRASAGKIVDARTGAALKGALVEIVETGEKTSTGDLGDFRFPGKSGSFNLRVSYLGYPPYEQFVELQDGRAKSGILLSDGRYNNEIVVYGTRSARAQALNVERTSDNVSTVISSDQMGRFAGSTLSESLRRAPGVAFQRDENTSDGTNIIVRGLAPDFNTITLNGVELPEGTGRGRSASLSNVLTESIGQVTIHKTLLPSQDSSGTGGLVEVLTKSPLDRSRRYASLSVEGAKKAKGFNDELLFSGTFSAKFGASENFGVSASVQYRDRRVERVRTETLLQYGQYLPVDNSGAPISSEVLIDPRTPFPFEPGVDTVYPVGNSINIDSTETKNLALSTSIAWNIANHSKLRLDFNRFSQDDTSIRTQSFFSAEAFYVLRPIAALGGEERYGLTWSEDRPINFSHIDNYLPHQETNTSVLSFRGETHLGRFDFEYDAGWTSGRTRSPNYTLGVDGSTNLQENFILPDAVDPVEGLILSPYFPLNSSGFPLPLLTEEGFAYFGDPANYRLSAASFITYSGRNQRTNGAFKTRYNPESSWLKYIEAGISYERSKFRNGQSDIQNYVPVRDELDQNPTFDNFNASFSDNPLSRIGVDARIRAINPRDLVTLLTSTLPNMAPVYDEADPATYTRPTLVYNLLFQRDERLNQARTQEEELAAYAQAKLEFGRLDITGGVRMTRVSLQAVNLIKPLYYREDFSTDPDFEGRFEGLIAEKASQTDFLPRILVNYRMNENSVIRFGYYKSVARPQINLLSSTPSVILILFPYAGPNLQPALNVSKGNPDLKPSSTDSFDVSLEKYDGNIGVIKLGAFYKKISNLLENNSSNSAEDALGAAGVLPDFPAFDDVLANPQNYFFSVTYPVNNPSPAHIWGIEASLERRFPSLPGALGGLGIYANYTYTRSQKQQPVQWSFSPVVDENGAVTGYETIEFTEKTTFDGQPRHSGTVALTYNKYNIDATLAYSYQSARQLGFSPYGRSKVEDSYKSLDLRVEYFASRLPGKPRLFVEGTDLLRPPSKPAASNSYGAAGGDSRYRYESRYFGGRQIRAGLQITF